MNVSFAGQVGLLGLSRAWDPNYHFDAARYPGLNYEVEKDKYPFPYPPEKAVSMTRNWADAAYVGQQSYAARDAAISMFRAAIESNTQFSKDAGDYYHVRVGRTSGGKASRLSQEGDAVQDGVKRANQLFASTILQIQKVTAAQTATQLPVNPAELVPVKDPNTGVVSYQAPNYARPSTSMSGSGLTKYVLPIAAIGAAYFALK